MEVFKERTNTYILSFIFLSDSILFHASEYRSLKIIRTGKKTSHCPNTCSWYLNY